MPEWSFQLDINYFAPNESEAMEIAQSMGEMIFTLDDVNSVEAPFGPTWLKDDE